MAAHDYDRTMLQGPCVEQLAKNPLGLAAISKDENIFYLMDIY